MGNTVKRLLGAGILLAAGCTADAEAPRTSDPNPITVWDPAGQAPAQVAPQSAIPPATMAPAPVDQGALPMAGAGANPPAMQAPDAMMPAPMAPDPVMPDPVMPAPMTPDPAMPDPAAPATANGDAVPAGEHCAGVSEWDPMWSQFEEEVLRLTNEARAVGHNCDSMGEFGPAEPLTMNAELRCSARLHSMDMGVQGYFAHASQDGTDPFQRMAAAGYSGRVGGENIAKGQQSPEEVVNGWLDSDGHCANMMNPGYAELGVGFWEGEAENRFFNGNKLWTQNFGSTGGGGNCWWCQ